MDLALPETTYLAPIAPVLVPRARFAHLAAMSLHKLIMTLRYGKPDLYGPLTFVRDCPVVQVIIGVFGDQVQVVLLTPQKAKLYPTAIDSVRLLYSLCSS